MQVGKDIARLGFRRWYERQLVESHAYLVAAFLALILLLAGFESLERRSFVATTVLSSSRLLRARSASWPGGASWCCSGAPSSSPGRRAARPARPGAAST